MTAPDLSVVIPVFNRGDLIHYTLESVRRASAGLRVETIVIDDGSTPPTVEALDRLGFAPTQLHRQENRGLLFARLAGLAHANGRYTLFLDSDDLVSPEKFRLQLAAMDSGQADVSYTDSAHAAIEGDYDSLVPVPDPSAIETMDAAEFFISVQPAPHSPIFRTDWLRSVVAGAFFPPSSLYNSVAEIWFYHNAAPCPARIVKVPGPHTIIGTHPGARLTNHWEKLGVASLAVMEAFARTSPSATPTARRARQLVGEKAFGSWRRLPRGFPPDFAARTLALWQTLTDRSFTPSLGGGLFQKLARLLGPVAAARMLHRFQAGPYAACRTMSDDEFAQLLSALPPA